MTAALTFTTKGPQMKTIISALALSLAASVAGAETITLGPVGCGLNFQCYNIPNDKAVDVDLNGGWGVPKFWVAIDGVYYSGPSQNGANVDTFPMYDLAGNVVYLTAQFSTFHTCTRSGRGQHCSTHWNLLGGSVVR